MEQYTELCFSNVFVLQSRVSSLSGGSLPSIQEKKERKMKKKSKNKKTIWRSTIYSNTAKLKDYFKFIHSDEKPKTHGSTFVDNGKDIPDVLG